MVSQNYNNLVANGFSHQYALPSSLSSFSQHQNQHQRQRVGGISKSILSSSSSSSNIITTSISSIIPFHDSTSSVKCSTKTKSFSLHVPSSTDKSATKGTRKKIWYRRPIGQSLKQKLLFWRNSNNNILDNKNSSNNATSTINTSTTTSLDFTYEYDIIELMIGGGADSDSAATAAATASTRNTRTTGIVLIHPIGVGISRWYYQRLIS